MKLGTETGSLVNHLFSGPQPIVPEVGMGCTMLSWTDRYAGTIIKVTPCTITVQRDKTTRIDNNGLSELQEYRYERDPDGTTYIFRKTKKGWRCSGHGMGLLIGERREYYDHSF